MSDRYPEPHPIIEDDALIAQVTVELGQPDLKCPNCEDPIKGHMPTGCMMGAFIYVLRDRIGEWYEGVNGEGHLYTEADVLRTWVTMDPDGFWDDVSPILNHVQDNKYKQA